MIKYVMMLVSILGGEGVMCQEVNVLKAEIKFVSPQIETPFSIQCDNFEKDLNLIKSKTVYDSAILKEIEVVLKSIKYANVLTAKDIRSKVYVYFRNETMPTIICSDRFNSLLVNGKNIKRNKKLINLLYRLTLSKS